MSELPKEVRERTDALDGLGTLQQPQEKDLLWLYGTCPYGCLYGRNQTLAGKNYRQGS